MISILIYTFICQHVCATMMWDAVQSNKLYMYFGFTLILEGNVRNRNSAGSWGLYFVGN
jgi:hypothetical protein